MSAYKLAPLGEELKKHGLDLAEDALEAVAESVLDWLVVSATASATPYDDVLVALVPVVKKHVLVQIDKLDGEVG